jgi:hypothetical protein
MGYSEMFSMGCLESESDMELPELEDDDWSKDPGPDCIFSADMGGRGRLMEIFQQTWVEEGD